MSLNRSRIAVLLLTVFALTVLGIAAGTLESAHPRAADTPGTGDEPETLGGQGAVTSPPAIGDSSSSHFVLQEVDVTNSLQDEQAQSGGVLARLVLGVILLIFGAALVVWRLTSDESAVDIGADDETDTLVDEQPPDTPSRDTRDAQPTNEVYRAWRSMIAALDGDVADTKSPMELAETAVNAGFPESEVIALTEMFCNVRYGGMTPTDEQEQQAQETLEEIYGAIWPDEPNQSDSPLEQ